ncbi:tetratricopeptide repeat-containing diguanylate cyclase [Undibacterium luofuense]|uniref:diguanylate cyclase n=1 Tax=Undibacterium luofuense TaxID=2828733 RepID=A0A941DNE1_9BURK|nr:diguanylate cyclase [Undibacterium luofuense]MBR7781941.1 diguanylate cyclase [Undibacterium luofuense]
MRLAENLRKFCCIALAFSWIPPLTAQARQLEHLGIEVFSPFETEMDQLANRYGDKPELALKHLADLKAKTANPTEISTALAYRCGLLSGMRKNKEIAGVLSELDALAADGSQRQVKLAAMELCKLYALGDNERNKYDSLVAAAFHFIKSTQAPTLRYWISTMYVEMTSRQGRARDAMEAAKIALNVARSNNDARRQSTALRDLALIEVDFGNKEDALAHINEAIRLAQSGNAPASELEYMLNRGFILTALHQLKEAKKCYQQAEDMAIEQARADIPGVVWSNLSDIAYQEGKFLESKALSEKLLQWANSRKDERLAAYARVSLGIVHVRLGQTDLADTYFREGIRYFESEKQLVDLKEYYGVRAEALAAAGDFKRAYLSLEKKLAYGSEIDLNSRGHDAAELRELLKTEQREKENLELRQQAQQSRVAVKEAQLRIQRWWLLAGLLGVFLLAAIQVIWFSRRKNQLLERENQHLDRERYLDALTGLHNRRFLMDRKSPMWTHALQEHQRSRCAAIMIIDADFFKKVNDTYGHAAGDAALIDIANRLKRNIRESDLLVRWGGEEFVIFTDAPNQEGLINQISRLMQDFKPFPLVFEGQQITLSVSIGYALMPLQWADHSNADIDQSLILADSALYLAKSRGRNRAVGVHLLQQQKLDMQQILQDLSLAEGAGEVILMETTGPK